MEYHEAATTLLDLRRFRPSPGTAATAALLEHVEAPQEGLPAVQVAGSNGKGSTARMLESILREAGHSVGLFTSPHLTDLRERIRVDGRPIGRAEIADFVEACEGHLIERAADGDSPTFFEATTALALWHFERADVDVAVLEVGIGGKYDATSVVDPIAAAVTSVSLEHTGIIGDTIEAIARDKAHVAPADRPLVTAVDEEALGAVTDVAGAVRTVGTGGDRDVRVAHHGPRDHRESLIDVTTETLHLERVPIALHGDHQAENAGVAVALAEQVLESLSSGDGYRGAGGTESLDSGGPDPKTVARGLRGATWPGRFEVMEREPLVVLDGAHTPDACERVARTLEGFDAGDVHLVIGSMKDKDHRDLAARLPEPASVQIVEPDMTRAESAAVLERVYREAGAPEVRVAGAVEDGLAGALDRADPADCVLVTGSLYAVAEARMRWARPVIEHDPTGGTGGEVATSRALTIANVPAGRREQLADAGEYRVLRTRLRERQAGIVQSIVRSLGGECAISAVTAGDAFVDVVVLGTTRQLRGSIERLREEPDGLGPVADQLERHLEWGPGGASHRVRGADPPGSSWLPAVPAVMGIVNVTPDSFHDGGAYNTVEAALDRGRRLVEAGATVLDVGGESTRPGADPVTPETERERILPVIEELADLEALVSVDTRRADVAAAAIDAGADVINDVSGLSDPGMRILAADRDVPLVVAHAIDTPVVPDRAVHYDDVVADVVESLAERVLLAEQAGLDRERILVDPGLGFGKTPAENVELLSRIGELRSLGCPVLVGHSHKSLFTHVGYEAGDRLAPTIAATALAVDRGAHVLRVHDVPENVAAVRTAVAVGTHGIDGLE